MNWWRLRRQLHSSWLIAIVCLALVVGVFLTQYITPTLFASVGWGMTGLLLALVGLWRRYVYLIGLLIVGSLLIGVWRGSVQKVDLSDVQRLYGSVAKISGNVREDVDSDGSG